MRNTLTPQSDLPSKTTSHSLLVLVLLLTLVISEGYAQVLIPYNSNWKYAPESNTAPAATWKTSGFDDASWKSGNAPFAFGSHVYNTLLERGPNNTTPNYPAFYFRKTVNIPSTGAYSSIRLRAYLDDGIVIYVNGVEVKRKNMNANVNDPYTRAAGDSLTIDTLLNISLFQNGNNLIAAEVHQTGETSGDILFNLQLEGTAAPSQSSMLIPYQSGWKYAPESNTAPASTWKTSGFDDASWKSGNAPFAFGAHFYNTLLQRGPNNTTPNYPAFYFRKTINIVSTAAYSSIRLRAYLDDGIVIYVNGVEVKRKNMNANPNDPYTRAAGDSLTIDTLLSTSLFQNGNNLISAEVHQTGETSGDILFDLQLEGTTTSTPASMVIAYQSGWKYATESNTAPASNWKTSAFDDASWKNGNAPFAFGPHFYNTLLQRGPNNTTPNYPAFYFRKTVNIANAAANNSYRLRAYLDDGIVIYVNGVEVKCKNMNANPNDPFTRAAGDSLTIDTLLSASLFQNGNNLIAAEVHQTGETSGDILFDLQLEGSSTSNAPYLTRYPYLQLASHNRMTVQWYTNLVTTATVRYSTNSNLSSGYTEVAVPQSDLLHVVTLKNLTPDTKYYYSVGYGTGNNFQLLQYNAAVNYFQTLPTDTSHPLRFWLLGDSGAGNYLNPRPFKVRDAYLAYLNSRNNPYVDGIVFLGDNSNTSPYEGLQQALDTTIFKFYNRPNDKQLLSHMPSWTVIGNHDYDPDPSYLHSDGNTYFVRKAYHKQTAASFSTFAYPDSAQIGGQPTFNKKGYYSFNQGDVHFVVLNPPLIEKDNIADNWLETFLSIKEIFSKNSIALDYNFNTPIDSLPQVKWLVKDLSTNTKKWTIVTFHLPPFSTIGHFPDEKDLTRVREKLMPILEKPEYHVDALLVSHSHAYLRAGMIRKNGNAARTTDSYQAGNNLGRYPASPPYIKSNNETAYSYLLSGSAGRGFFGNVNNNGTNVYINDSGYDDPAKVKHPSISTPPFDTSPRMDNVTGDNTTDFYHVKGGSIELLFQENRLDVKFIKESDVSPNFVIADSFVVMKDVNKTKSYNIQPGDQLTLKASWVGDYVWYSSQAPNPLRTAATENVLSTGLRERTFNPTQNINYYVVDGHGYLVDTFRVFVGPPLPVNLLAFTATKSEAGTLLNWSTTSETNSDRFEIQRSDDATSWLPLGNVTAKGESKVSQTYSYLDRQPKSGDNYYRLKMIDRDGTFAYSRIISIQINPRFEIVVYPNPVEDNISLKVTDWKQVRSVTMINTAGTEVYNSGPVMSGIVNVKNISPGMYILKIVLKDGSVYTHRMFRIK